MARQSRSESFSPDEIATVHLMNRVVRRCFLMGVDTVTGNDYNHRKLWFEDELERLAAQFGIDLLNFAILCNHFHLILRSRPDVVNTWKDREVAKRWCILCPKRKTSKRSAGEPTQAEINSITSNKKEIKEIRSRLSDISWWMRLMCQRIAQWANKEDKESGKFWQARFRAVRLLDESAILAGAAYVDLNPLRAAIAESLQMSEHTSLQRRLGSMRALLAAKCDESEPPEACAAPSDDFLAPLEINESSDELGPRPNQSGTRCSDKGFLTMPLTAYIGLLEWTARQIAVAKTSGPAPPETPETRPPALQTVARCEAPPETPPPLERLNIKPEVWCQLVSDFGAMFSLVAGTPESIDSFRSRHRGCRYYMPRQTRQLMA